ncbi:MAG: ATP synthase F1 subunit delta [Alphaproteobacteria bacterium]
MSLNSQTQQIAKRYATALFKLSMDNKNLDKVVADVDALTNAFSENEEFSRIIKSPALKIDEAAAVLSQVLTKLNSGDELKGLAKTVCENRRQFAMEAVLAQFKQLVDDHNGVVNAEVVSAVELKADQLKSVEGVIADAVGGDVRVSYVVKPAIVGGLIVKIGSKMIDASVQTKLDKLKLEMKGA